MPKSNIHAFSPFALQLGGSRRFHQLVQDAVYYGESRFRRALYKIIEAQEKDKGWMQRCLQQDLVRNICFESKIMVS